MSADENIKKFTLVGGKSELEALGKQGSRKRRGGGPSNVPPGPSYQMTSANVAQAQAQLPVPVPVQLPVQNGAAYNQHKNVKVILTPKKKKTAVVLEAPKKRSCRLLFQVDRRAAHERSPRKLE